MIAPAEIQRTAAALGVSQDVVEHDYTLGCFLHYLGEIPEIKQSWVFKGGTCLAKCHFTHYRFSEDLDFTLTESIQPAALVELLDLANRTTQAKIGIRMEIRPTALDIIHDDFGKESIEAKVYYESVWRPRSSPRSIRVHVNRDEALLFPVMMLRINHSYSDAKQLPDSALRVYALEEIVAEKLRALAGQRKYAVARDLYDLWSLDKAGVHIDSALKAFTEKCETKGLSPTSRDLDRLIRIKNEFESNWKNNLEYLIPADLQCPFAEAWDVSITLLRKALHK